MFLIHAPLTYGHSCLRTLDPVRSPHVKQANARSVVAWVTSSKSRVLYVLVHPFLEVYRETLREFSFLAGGKDSSEDGNGRSIGHVKLSLARERKNCMKM